MRNIMKKSAIAVAVSAALVSYAAASSESSNDKTEKTDDASFCEKYPRVCNISFGGGGGKRPPVLKDKR